MSINRESRGQEFLMECNLIGRRSDSRVRLLACMACRWAKNPENPQAYGYEVVKCSGLKSGVVYPLLAQFNRAEVTQSVHENAEDAINDKRAPRKYIVPADNRLGEAFRQTLEVPGSCNLD